MPGIVCIAEPGLVEAVFVKANKMYLPGSTFGRAPSFAARTRAAMGASVTGFVGEEWRWRKTALTKAFHTESLLRDESKLFERICAEAETLCGALGEYAVSGAPCPVDTLMTAAAVRIVMFLLFGKVRQQTTLKTR